MPWGDRTGPNGMGPMTGRGLGYCTGHSAPGHMNPAPGRGMGRRGVWGRGFYGGGRGWRHSFWATGLPGWSRGVRGPMAYGATDVPAPEQEAEYLNSHAKWLENELKAIRKRLDELNKEKKEEK